VLLSVGPLPKQNSKQPHGVNFAEHPLTRTPFVRFESGAACRDDKT